MEKKNEEKVENGTSPASPNPKSGACQSIKTTSSLLQVPTNKICHYRPARTHLSFSLLPLSKTHNRNQHIKPIRKTTLTTRQRGRESLAELGTWATHFPCSEMEVEDGSFSFSPTLWNDPPGLEVSSHHAFVFRRTFSGVHRFRAEQCGCSFTL